MRYYDEAEVERMREMYKKWIAELDERVRVLKEALEQARKAL